MTTRDHSTSKNRLRLLPAIIAMLLVMAGCASMGRPGGGPRDTTPPVFIYSSPAPGTLNFDGKRLRVYFDENVQVEDPMNKVVVSPVQIKPPSVQAIGRFVQVEFRDTLLPNTTYTIDFADAIADLNEKNVIDGFATDFSTGPTIDSLRISGMVFKADNLEPAQGMIVGVYSNLADSAISTLPLERITKTNKYGQFTLRNLKPVAYRIFAINDLNRDYHWDRSEDIAFYDTIITPWCETVTVADTLRGADGSDSIASRSATAFFPNDILLTWFNENYSPLYLAKYERPDRRKLYFEFAAPSDSFPTLTIVDGARAGLTDAAWSTRSATARRDTLTYWITDSMVYNNDSLTIAARYLATDSLENDTWRTDTLKFYLRGNKTRKAELKRAAEEAERRRKALEKGDTLPEAPKPLLTIRMATPTPADLNRPLRLAADQPIVRFDPSGVKLEIMVDTLWTELPAPQFAFPNPFNTMEMEAPVEWEPGAKYRFTVDSAAVEGALGLTNKLYEQSFNTKRLEDYSTITFNIAGADSATAVVAQLLSSADIPVATVAAERQPDGSRKAYFDYITPGTYFARLFFDANGNGVYDDGSFTLGAQPEEVYYFNKKINLKKNWDVAQTWNIYELPLDVQKPEEVKKNRADKNKKAPTSHDEDEEEEPDDTFNYGATNPSGNRNSHRPQRR